MAKKYELPIEENTMASEPSVAYALQYKHTPVMSVVVQDEEDEDWEDTDFFNPRLHISEEKLRAMGRSCINASCVSAEEAINHFLSM